MLWWGYLHQNGAVIAKRYFGDVKDYTTDCEGNDFIIQIIPPFAASSREEAFKIVRELTTTSLNLQLLK